jgi:hypothetical protein
MGRIFKISHSSDQWKKVDLYKASDKELVECQLNKNEWYVRQARQILQERGPNKKVHKMLKEILANNPDETRKLRALWALHVTKGLDETELLALLSNDSEYVRSWAIQLIAEDKNPSPVAMKRFAELAASDQSAMVRLYLTSALQRVEPAKRFEILEALVQHEEDKDDHNLPLMLWYALEPTVPVDMNRALAIAAKAKAPRILTFTKNRLTAINTPDAKKVLDTFNQQIGTVPMDHSQHKMK